MEDPMAGLVPASTASSDNYNNAEDARVESLLTEKLMSGHILLDAACPSCATPLVKLLQQQQQQQENNSTNNSTLENNDTNIQTSYSQQNVTMRIISSQSFDPPLVAPLFGIPYCVSCSAHVVMTEEDVLRLEKCDSLIDKGMILVALEHEYQMDLDMVHSQPDIEEPTKTMDTQEEAAAAVERISERIRQNVIVTDLLCGSTVSRQLGTSPVAHVMELPNVDDYQNHITTITTTTIDQLEEETIQEPTTFYDLAFSASKEALAAADEALARVAANKSTVYYQEEEEEEEGVEADLELYALTRVDETEVEPSCDTNDGDNDEEEKVKEELAEEVQTEEALIVEANEAEEALIVNENESEDTPLVEQEQNPPVPAEENAPTPSEEPEVQQQESNEELPTQEPTTVPQENTDVVQVVEEEKKDDEDEDGLGDYSVRRDIATKVLGAKMLQGYVLKDMCCTKCGMPLMEYAGELDCVVCPVLVKKAKKKLKAEQRAISTEETGLNQVLLRQAQEDRRKELQKEEEERMIMEERAVEEAQRAEQERLLQEAQRLEEERLAAAKEEEEKLAELERLAEEQRLEAERLAKEESVEQLLRDQLARLEEARLLQEQLVEEAAKDAENRILEEVARLEAQAAADEAAQKAYEEARALELQEQEEQRRMQVEKVLQETLRLEAMERNLQSGERSVQSHGDRSTYSADRSVLSNTSSLRDLHLRETDRQRLEIQMAMVKAAEEARIEAELETRREAEERRANEESRMIAILQDEANRKTKAAEEAIERAKAALEEVSSAKRYIIANTIAQAEAEAIAEAESIVMADAEGFTQPPGILQTASCLERERWDLLRSEGRSVLTRRLMQGWEMLADLCQGAECLHSPLLKKGSVTECVVCGGTGSGRDGVYENGLEDDDESEDDSDDNGNVIYTPPPAENREFVSSHGSTYSAFSSTSSVHPPAPIITQEQSNDASSFASRAMSPISILSVDKIKEEFDSKRNLVSKEIGKKMMEGWTLLDGSCPNCVMPLMTNGEGGPDTCVLCGPLVIEEERTPRPFAFDEDERTPRSGNNKERCTIETADEEDDAEEMEDEETKEEEEKDDEEKKEEEKDDEEKTEENTVGSQSDAPAPIKAMDGLEKRPATPRSDPPAMVVDDEDTYSKAPDLEKTPPSPVVPSSPVRDSCKETAERFDRDLAIETQDKSSDEMTFTLPANFDPTDESSVLKLLSQLQATKRKQTQMLSPRNTERALPKETPVVNTKEMDLLEEMSFPKKIVLPKRAGINKARLSEEMFSHRKMDRALANGTAIVNTRSIDVSDEMSLMTGVSAFARQNEKPKPDFSPKRKPKSVPSALIQDDEIAALERELNLRPPTPKVLPPRPLPTRSRSNSGDKAPPSPAKPQRNRLTSYDSSPGRKSCHSSPGSQRIPPRPEDDSPGRSRGPSRSNSLRSLRMPPLSPKVVGRGNNTYGHTPVVIGGTRDDVSVMSDGIQSRAESVASDALSAILDRIEDCKNTLQTSHNIMEQVEMASLIEKLASAAVGLKKLEELGITS